MEIGYPTDVKHVAHIGLDGPSGSAPSWMTEFKTASEFSTTSLGSFGEFRDSNSMALSTWSSQDFEQSVGRQQNFDMFNDVPPTDSPNIPKKQKRKKSRSTSSPKSSSSRSSRAKSKTASNDMDATSNLRFQKCCKILKLLMCIADIVKSPSLTQVVHTVIKKDKMGGLKGLLQVQKIMSSGKMESRTEIVVQG